MSLTRALLLKRLRLFWGGDSIEKSIFLYLGDAYKWNDQNDYFFSFQATFYRIGQLWIIACRVCVLVHRISTLVGIQYELKVYFHRTHFSKLRRELRIMNSSMSHGCKLKALFICFKYYISLRFKSRPIVNIDKEV